MLIEFRVENHRSLKTEQVLTMEAGRVDGDATIPRTVPGYSKPLLPVAALYGANASGKSNVLSGLAFMREAVVHSLERWKPNGGIPRDPFAWGEARTAPSMYEITFSHRGIRYRYGMVVSDESVEEEWLHAWPKGKQQTWFEREGQKFDFGDHLKGERRLLQEVTGPNSLFVSMAAAHNHPQISELYNWFFLMESFGVPPYSNERRGEEFVFSGLMKESLQSEHGLESISKGTLPDSVLWDIRNLLVKADVGITEIKMKENYIKAPVWKDSAERFMLQHESGVADSWLPLQQESKGTQTMFQTGSLICYVLRSGGVLLVDELEASLHPKLALEIVKQFNNPQTNPKNAQLIFTTHDTNLLGNDAGEPVLRRDQVWLTEKDKEGATVLYPLTDFKPRKAENMERGYLQGRYGAIPYLGNFSLLGEGAT